MRELGWIDWVRLQTARGAGVIIPSLFQLVH